MPRKKATPEESEQLTPEENELTARMSNPTGDALRQFFSLDFRELDRNLTEEERDEWNAIYASYRGRSALSGIIIGVDHFVNNYGNDNVQDMYCATVIPYRVRIIIPATEMWMDDFIVPDFAFRGMVGAKIEFVITRVEREAGFAIASRREAMRSRRYYFSRHQELWTDGARTKCQVLTVGPRRCIVECHGHDLNITQWELSYAAIADLRTFYHPGTELSCIVKSYDAEKGKLNISVKEAKPNPYDGASTRHPTASRRQAVISGKYAGGVFCNLPDGAVCMCSYSYQYEDSDFKIGDFVILRVQRFDDEKKQMYGKILSKW